MNSPYTIPDDIAYTAAIRERDTAAAQHRHDANRYDTPPAGPPWFVTMVLAERRIRARQREIVHEVHHASWRVGSPETQRAQVAWARLRHSESVRRERADTIEARAALGLVPVGLAAAEE